VLLAADHPVVPPKDSTKNDSTKTDTTKTDTTKADTAKADSSKKDYIPSVSPAGASHLEIANHGDALNVNYVLPVAQNVRISLVSIKGNILKRHTPGRELAGSHELRWNVEQVPAGVYLVEYRAGSVREYSTVRIGR
jgi:endo-1,4-beta-xylanase